MTPSIVAVDGEHVTVAPAGVDIEPRRFTSMREAAGYVAVATLAEPVYVFARSCADRGNAAGFDVVEFADLVDEALRDLKASNGWRVHASSGDHTIWARPGIDDIGIVYDAIFNVTRGETPSGPGGYYRLNSILRAKGLSPADIALAKGDETMVRAQRGPDFEGKPAWHGLYLREGEWRQAGSHLGPIAYKDPASARAGALVQMAEAAAPEAAAPGMR